MQKEIKFSRGEELANGISHFAGALLAVVGTIVMIRYAMVHGNSRHVFSSALFGATMVVLYLSSTLTHLLPAGRIKDRFYNLDLIAIYFLIAGTYTPIALVTLNGRLGWIIFGIEWGVAVTGTVAILSRPGNYNRGAGIFNIVSYLMMGWLILIAIERLLASLPLMGLLWILIGGISYSLGIMFFRVIRFPYHHLVWHLLVIGGTLSHFFAIFFFVIRG